MIADYGIAEYDAGVLSQHKANADFFEAAAQGLDRKTAKLLCNLFMGDALALLNASGKEIGACALTPDALRALVVLSAKGTINGPTVKDLLPELFEKGGVLSDDAPPVNEVAERYVEKGTEETGAVNTVAGMILDYRAFDTLGESFVLFTAMCAVTMLMNAPGKRRVRKLDYEVLDYYQDPIIRTVCKFVIPIILVFGVYILLNGHLSPGGGFSGGASQRPFKTFAAAQSAFRESRVTGQSLLQMFQPGGMIVRIHNQFQMMNFRQPAHPEQAAFKFLRRSNIGIGIVQRNFPFFRQQTFHTCRSTGSAAYMQQKRFHFSGDIPLNAAISSGLSGA